MRLLVGRRDGEPLSVSYVRRAVHNAIRDAVRAHDRRRKLMERHRVTRLAHRAQHDEDATRADPLAKVVLRDALDQLDPQRRQIVLGYLEGNSTPEMARSLGWNSKKASNTLWRTLAQLRRELRAQGIERRRQTMRP